MINNVLEKIVKECINNIGYDIDVNVINSNRPELCDYQFDGCFKLASIYKKNPIEIGEEIEKSINSISDFNDYFKKVEFVRPGFINMTLSNKIINKILKKMNDNEKFNIKQEKEELYFLDYGGANVAKPLHVGHMRTAIIGESIKRILNYMGHKTICDVHLGDYGLQIGEVIYGIKKDNLSIDDIDINYLDKIYPYMSKLCKEDEKIKEECALITKELQEGNDEYRKLWKKILEVSKKDIKKNYDYLGVNFDLWLGESDSYNDIKETEELLKSKNLLTLSDGALVVDVKEDTDKKEIPPLLFKKSNGAYLYASTDLATLLERKRDYNPDHVLYVTDLRQALHFEQVFRVSDKAGIISKEKLEHLPYGTANGLDGKPFKTRNGDNPKLESLFNEAKEIFKSKKESNLDMSESDLDKIVNSIVKFADLQNNREKDYIFDINKFSEVVGKTGPYILYTYLRINKITKNVDIISDNIYNDSDRNLRLKLLELERFVKNAYINRMPNFIAEYLYDLCVCANAFYQNNHLSNLDDDTKRNDWMYVLNLTNKVIKEMLNLLVIEIPTIM